MLKQLNKHRIPFIFILTGLVLSLIIFRLGYSAFAQPGPSVWTDPVNLSRSGGTSEPHIVVDSKGLIHVYWMNEFYGITYTYRDQAGVWMDPIPVPAPFEESLTTLQLLPDPRGAIHAFWLDKNSNLFYSRSINTGASLVWEGSQYLAGGVVDFHVVMKESLIIHLGYVAFEESPTGIYYRSMGETGIWSSPELIYPSKYFRNLTPEDAHIWIDAGANERVYLSWDDHFTEHVFIAWSTDSGKTWSDPGIIDQREEEDDLSSVGPSKIMVHVNIVDPVVLWQAGHASASCTQYFEVIPEDASASATAEGDHPSLNLLRQPLTIFSQGCPEKLQLLEADDDKLWLLSELNNRLQLSTWSGSEWSQLQSQTELSELIHPETFRRLDLDYHQAAIFQNNLLVVGCDNGITKDTWFLERPLGDTATWFPTPTPAPLWSIPVVVTQGEETISAPILIASPNHRLHAFWGGKGGRIYYAYFDGDRWAQPVAVITSPGEQVGKLSAAIDQNSNLFVTWDNPGSEAIYYSWVEETEANISSNWMVPQALPIPNIIRSPQVVINPEGNIEIAYVVPLNESRGLYLIRSIEPILMNQSLQWETPELVFDAEAARWPMVDDVRFALGMEDARNLIWTRYDLPPDGGAIALYYTYLTSGTWSEPKEIYKDAIDWSQILTTTDGSIHIAWQVKEDDNRSTLWHSYSTDQGAHWSDPIRISGFSSAEGPSSLVLDQAGRIQLVQVNQSGFINLEGQSSLTLQNWIFNGTEWETGERMNLDNLINPQTLSSNIALDNNLAALLLAEIMPENEGDQPATALIYSQLPVDISETIPTPLPTFTPIPTITADNQTLEPTPTPMLEFPTDSNTRLPAIFNSRWAGIFVGGIPAVLIVALALTAILRRSRK